MKSEHGEGGGEQRSLSSTHQRREHGDDHREADAVTQPVGPGDVEFFTDQ